MTHKDYCKLEVYYNKYSPVVISILTALDNFFHIDSLELGLLDYLFLPSLFTVGHMYISRCVLKLCSIHKLFVDYVVINVIYKIIYHSYLLDITDYGWFCINLITLIVFIILLSVSYYDKMVKNI